MEEYLIGKVIRYLDKKKVAVVVLSRDFKKSPVHIRGRTTDFEMDDFSLHIKGNDVTEASAGTEVGLSVSSPVRPDDEVFKVVE